MKLLVFLTESQLKGPTIVDLDSDAFESGSDLVNRDSPAAAPAEV